MSTFKLSRPSGGDNWDKAQHLDHLHVFCAADGFTIQEIETSYGMSAAVKVDWIVCCDCLDVWDDQFVYGAVLTVRLAGADSEIVVGRLGQGLPKPGKSAAWTLDDVTDQDMADAEAFLDKYVTVMSSGTIIVDKKALEADQDKGDDKDKPF
jgi:hypothetical protein